MADLMTLGDDRTHRARKSNGSRPRHEKCGWGTIFAQERKDAR
jgi:hypothetical protein